MQTKWEYPWDGNTKKKPEILKVKSTVTEMKSSYIQRHIWAGRKKNQWGWGKAMKMIKTEEQKEKDWKKWKGPVRHHQLE